MQRRQVIKDNFAHSRATKVNNLKLKQMKGKEMSRSYTFRGNFVASSSLTLKSEDQVKALSCSFNA